MWDGWVEVELHDLGGAHKFQYLFSFNSALIITDDDFLVQLLAVF